MHITSIENFLGAVDIVSHLLRILWRSLPFVPAKSIDTPGVLYACVLPDTGHVFILFIWRIHVVIAANICGQTTSAQTHRDGRSNCDGHDGRRKTVKARVHVPVSQERRLCILAQNFRQMLTNFQTSFTGGLSSKHVMKWSLKIPPNLKRPYLVKRKYQ